MRKTGIFFLMAFCAIAFAGCTPATNTATTNTNTNTAKPAAAAPPTTEALLDMEKKAQEAYSKADTKYFETLLSDKTVMSMGKERMGKAATIEMIGKAKCEGFEVKLSEPQLSKIDNDTYAFTYRSDSTGKCNEGKNGAMVDMKPTRASTVWVRSGDKWQAVWHSENEIMAAESAEKKDDTSAATKDAAKPPAPAKAEEAKKDEKPAGNANSAAAPAPAKLTPSANTDALTKMHAAGWEAFRNKDAKWFEDHMASTFAFVDPAGTYFSNKADTIKEWTGGGKMKCEGITKTSFTEGFAQALSPTVEILFGKGNADGKCDGQPNGDLWTTAVYVKEGDAWKLAYMFESLPRG
jgi:ketosteroid isomerase-like protein